MIEDANGYKAWWVNGKRHRVDGPAMENVNGYKEWWVDGKLHRIDGPAIEDVSDYNAWYVDGKRYSYEEWLKIIPNKISYLWRCYCGND